MNEKVTRKTGISATPLISLILCCAGAWLVPSGIALHFAAHEGITKWTMLFMGMHNSAAVIFALASIAHVIQNRKALSRYINTKVGKYPRFRREIIIAVLGVSAFVLLISSHELILP